MLLQGDQVPVMEGGNEVVVVTQELTNKEILEALLVLALAVTTHVSMCEHRVNVLESTMTSRLRVIVRMNHFVFIGSKVGEDPQDSLESMYKLLSFLGVCFRETTELHSYQLRDVSQVWYI